jgi:hypothetical protein
MPPPAGDPSQAHAVSARCAHLRQRNPLRSDALLVCAWPGCPEGTLHCAIQVCVEAASPWRREVLVELERESMPRGERFTFRWKSAP